ncbi:MAG TPA: hypothetical protein VHW69_14550 [Rhizomicrobium sp.]|jgi:hypothetical protein|nr:hypothetical protein [Rhizomicrobium sp.]
MIKPQTYTLLLLFGLAAAPLGAATPAGWQQVSDKAGRCTISVPGDWKAPFIKTSVESPDKNFSVIISSSDATPSLAEAKPLAQRMMPPVKTFQDSATRLWYQYEGNQGTGTHWYVAVQAQGVVCLAQLTYKSECDLAALKSVATSLSAR